MKRILKIFSFAAVMMLLTTASFAQGRGNLSGTVKDSNGSVLPGAAVFVDGTTQGTATDINGEYQLRGIPAGSVTIRVDYIGYEKKSVKVNVVAGQTISLNVVLAELAQSIENVTITAAIDGQQRSLNQQKAADNVMQVLSADQIGLFPDLNVADALKRVSGITSDGATISLRGTPNNFTSINVNGEQVMSNMEGGQRSPSLDLVPSDVLSSMEIQKTLLPSNDGDAIAGAINMRTGEARSLKPRFSVDGGLGMFFLRDKMSFNGKLGYSQRFMASDRNPNGVLGVAANISYFDSYNGYDRIEAQSWQLSDGLKEYTASGAGAALTEEYMPTDFRYRYQTQQSVRQGASLTLDWAPTLNTKIILSGLYNRKDNDGTRYRNRSRFRGNYYKVSGLTDIPDGSYAADRVMSVAQVSDIDDLSENYNINLEVRTTFGNWQLDGGAAFSRMDHKYRSEMDGFQTPEWRNGTRVRNTIEGINYETLDKNGNRPGNLSVPIVAYMESISSPYLAMKYRYSAFPTATYFGTFDSQEYYNLYVIENWNYNSRGDNMTFRLNASNNYFIGGNTSTLSFGVKGKFMTNDGYVPEGTLNYKVLPTLAANGRSQLYDNALQIGIKNFMYKEELEPKFLNGNLAFGPAANIDMIRQYVNANKEGTGNSNVIVNQYSSDVAKAAFDYESKEQVGAFYAMNKVQFNKLMVLAGFRVEANRVDYTANEVFRYDASVNLNTNPSGQVDPSAPVYNAFIATPKDSTINYTKFLPNVQFKYDLTTRTIMRAAWTTGYSRPNINDLLPKMDLNTDDSKVYTGNPNLKPAYANNIDVLGEHYLPSVGILSLGFFYKHIDEFIYQNESDINSTNPYSAVASRQVTSLNGDVAKVYGVEVTLNSALTFLPSFLKNLVFTGNYTYVHSSAFVNEDRGSMRLPGQADNTANLALAYSSKRFTIQAAYNYMGSYILAVGADADRDVWLDGRWQLDINGSVNIVKGLSFWVEASNVLNKESFQYYGDKSRVYSLQYSGAYGRAGLTYKF